jgi:starch phosphorylase
MPSWDSQKADEVWMNNAGKACWEGNIEHLPTDIDQIIDEEFWALRVAARKELVENVRRRMEYQFRQYGAEPEVIRNVKKALNPDALTIGFARRFASYKRPNLLLQNKERLVKILNNTERPVQLVVAGKAHPQDEEGKRLIQEMVQFSRQPQVAQSMVFLPDYDIELAQEMVQGIDVWINTPRRPWEACGTSGMKVLVNGGLNLSELDGWWAEAYRPGLGWSLGDGKEHDPAWDRIEADQLYRLLEDEIIPEYYERNERGIPVKWVNRIRRSMCELATQFNSNRMLSEYTEKMYRPAAKRLGLRTASDGKLSQELAAWQKSIETSWDKLSFGDSRIINQGEQWEVECRVFMDKLSPDSIAVEIIADPVPGHEMTRQGLTLQKRLPGEEPFGTFRGQVRADRPAEDFSLRIIPSHPSAIIPLESRFILWKHPI